MSITLYRCDGAHAVPLQAFWDATGQLWATGALAGKYASVFVSSGTPGGGQGTLSLSPPRATHSPSPLTESTVIASLSTLAHHGVTYVPLGYSTAFGQLTNLDEAHGGSPWGAGTLASGTGARQPSALELEVATIQCKSFYTHVAKAFP